MIIRPKPCIDRLTREPRSSTKTFAIWEDGDGFPVARTKSPSRFFKWAVVAGNPQQAMLFALDGITPSDRSDGRGVVWDRSTATCPPPLSADTRTWPYTLAWCRSPTAMWHSNESSALSALQQIDEGACGGACWRDHEIRWMTTAEVRRTNPLLDVWGGW